MAESEVDSGHIVGRPTLLVTYIAKLDAQSVLLALGGVAYPLADVRVYHRLVGTDQVIDAITGEVPAGEALSRDAAGSSDTQKLETLVLMHPDATQFMAVKGALDKLGDADYKYSEATVYEGKGV